MYNSFFEYYDEDNEPSKKFGGYGIDYGNEIRIADQHIDDELESYVNEMLCYESLISCQKEQKATNQAELAYVKKHINYVIDELDDLIWDHVGYVEVEETSNANTGYPNYKFYVEKGNPKSLKYMRQDDDGDYHNLVWQTSGWCEDDYSGFLLFPLNDGRYWKISYTC